MQVTASDPACDGFKPFDLTLRIESADEAARIFAIFNFSSITETLRIVEEGCKILEAIKSRTGLVKYNDYHSALCAKLKY